MKCILFILIYQILLSKSTSLIFYVKLLIFYCPLSVFQCPISVVICQFYISQCSVSGKLIFSASAPSPIQAISCNVRLSVCLSVQSAGTQNLMDRRLLVKERIAKVLKLRNPFSWRALMFFWFSNIFFGFW